ncbi:MAG TPA: metalloregulator ArsR/SmtB family transcription factor [Planosporangium sp.]|nr:metalloregulator ArsR/SmtB family transcription factor [Planosporangium sp.]
MTDRPSRGERDLDDIEQVFHALAHPSRRHILQVLYARGGMTAGALANRFSHSWPTVTRHVRELEQAGLVHCEQRGRERHYRVDRGRLLSVLGLWLGSLDAIVQPTRGRIP